MHRSSILYRPFSSIPYRVSPSPFYRSLLVLFLLGPILSSQAQGLRPRKVPKETQRKIDRIEAMSVPRLVKVFTEPEEVYRIPDHTVVGHHKAYNWGIAMNMLWQKMDEARPHLYELLDHHLATARFRALETLDRHDEDLTPIRGKLFKLMEDRDHRVRWKAIQTLRHLDDARTEARMLDRIKELVKKRKKDENEVNELRTLVVSVCHRPHDADKIIAALIPLMDNPKAETRLVQQAISRTRLLRVSNTYPRKSPKTVGPDLLECYWGILQRTDNYYLTNAACNGFFNFDSLAFPYLIRTAEIPHPNGRMAMTGQLFVHRQYKLSEHWDLIESLLTDKNSQVRKHTYQLLPQNAPESDLVKILDWGVHLLDDPDPEVRNTGGTYLIKQLVPIREEKRNGIRAQCKSDPTKALLEFMDKDKRSLETVVLHLSYSLHTQWDRNKEEDQEAARQYLRDYYP